METNIDIIEYEVMWKSWWRRIHDMGS